MVLRKCVFMIFEELRMLSSCWFEGEQMADVTLTVQISASQQFIIMHVIFLSIPVTVEFPQLRMCDV